MQSTLSPTNVPHARGVHQVAGDPRRPNDIVKYVPTVSKDDDLPDSYQLAALFLGMAALLLKVCEFTMRAAGSGVCPSEQNHGSPPCFSWQAKWAAWTSILCILCSLSNYSTRTDVKQLLRFVKGAVTVSDSDQTSNTKPQLILCSSAMFVLFGTASVYLTAGEKGRSLF